MFSQYLLSAYYIPDIVFSPYRSSFYNRYGEFWKLSLLTSPVSKELHFAIKIYPIIESKKNLREIQKELDNKHNATDNTLLFQ